MSTTTQSILLIDDDEAIQEFIKMALKNEGYNVFATSNAAMALDTIETINPFLILLDIFMPNMDGPTFVEAYRKKTGIPVPIILLTAANLTHDIPAGLTIDNVLEKPFNLDDLLAIVARYTPR
jgi:DNA-binding response OmpR family regulator